MTTLQQSSEWKQPPWDIKGKRPLYYDRIQWRYRFELYNSEKNARDQRIMDKINNG